MYLKETKRLDKVLEDIDVLKERSKLLEFILSRYDQETGTFNFPEKWRKHEEKRASEQLGKTPREWLKNKFKEHLTQEDLDWLGIYKAYY